jgi:hypothetical protein
LTVQGPSELLQNTVLLDSEYQQKDQIGFKDRNTLNSSPTIPQMEDDKNELDNFGFEEAINEAHSSDEGTRL